MTLILSCSVLVFIYLSFSGNAVLLQQLVALMKYFYLNFSRLEQTLIVLLLLLL